MQKIIDSIINKYYEVFPSKTSSLGGGSYARVFLTELEREPYKVVVKIYLFAKKAEPEALQLKILSRYALVKMPLVYYVHNGDDFISNDILLMEYIPGTTNAADVDMNCIKNYRQNIANEIIDNLIAFHQIINHEGFGEIGSKIYASNWNEYYKEKAALIMEKAKNMYLNGKIKSFVYNTMHKAFEGYDKIFYLPITTARLIHGDYNTWNILLNEQLNHVQAIIDPCNCCWADSEIDLYQLNNANGKYYGLFDLYKNKYKLSENYKIKISFYELFIEIMHYNDSNADTTYKPFEEKLFIEATDLGEQMKLIGI